MYGLRTVIPISIGLTRYDAKIFALINLLSAWTWAAITIVPVWYFGDEILELLKQAKQYWWNSFYTNSSRGISETLAWICKCKIRTFI